MAHGGGPDWLPGVKNFPPASEPASTEPAERTPQLESRDLNSLGGNQLADEHRVAAERYAVLQDMRILFLNTILRLSGDALEVTERSSATDKAQVERFEQMGAGILRGFGIRMKEAGISRIDFYNRFVFGRWGPWKRPSVSIYLNECEHLLGDLTSDERLAMQLHISPKTFKNLIGRPMRRWAKDPAPETAATNKSDPRKTRL